MINKVSVYEFFIYIVSFSNKKKGCLDDFQYVDESLVIYRYIPIYRYFSFRY